MLRNYLTIALRFMIRQKGFSFINIAGLTLGIAASLLILLYVFDELSFDRLHRDADRTYRITTEGRMQGKKIHSALTAYPLAATLVEQCPDVEATLRLANWTTFPMRYGNRAFTESNLLLADANFFSFFDFPLIVGNREDVLSGEGKIVITESAARRYFDYKGAGDITPIGKKMILAQGYLAEVTGIAADPPKQSHFHFTFVLSLDSWTEIRSEGWISSRVITYAKLKPDGSAGIMAEKLAAFTEEYVAPELKKERDLDINQYRTQGNDLHYGIQHLADIHLTSNLTDEIEPNGDMTYIYLFISIAVFIVVLACINFMNLSTARSASRAKEIGVRRAIGASNIRLVIQFLLESFFYLVAAVMIALFIVAAALGPFNYFTGKDLSVGSLVSVRLLIAITLFVVTAALLSGSYPAVYLTRFSTIEVLKGRIRRKLRGYSIRNVLVVFQFFISCGLIIATLTVYLQLRYIQEVELGFDKNHLVNLIHTANLRSNGKAFKDAVVGSEAIVAASYSNRLPPNVNWQYVFRPENTRKDFLINIYEVDHDHLHTLGYEMLKGRFFSSEYPEDSLAVILNEEAATAMGINHAGGQRVFTEYGAPAGTMREVIGIIKNFNFQSLRDSIQPVAMVLGKEPNWEMAVRIKAGQESEAIRHIHELWTKYAPDAPFEYSFLQQNFEAKMATEKKIALLFLIFTILAILIACLGLFGLATFTAEQRTKEIGIRKVLGASVERIVFLLNKDFLKLVLAANLVAWPVAGFLMTLWLHQFAYHIVIPWWIFPLTGLATSVIAFISVSSRAVNAAQGDPVNSLRDE